MIKVTVFKNEDNLITGFKVLGRKDTPKKARMLYAAVSALVINTVNSLDSLTSDRFDIKQDENEGLIEFHMAEPVSSDGNLLLNSLAIGLKQIAEEYTDKYIRIEQMKTR